MSKFKTMVRKDIELCDEYIDKNMATHSEVNALLGKYVMDYPDFNKNIISYASVPGYETNEIENIGIIKSKLEYLLNRSDNPDLYNKQNNSGITISNINNNNNTNNVNFNMSIEDIKSNIDENTYLSDLDKKELLNKMTPFLMGGDMIEYVYEQNTTFAPLPNKFEAGTQNVEGVIGLGSAIDYIEKIGYKEIQNVEEAITKYAVNELSKLDFLELYITPHLENHSTVISFNIKGVHPHDVASILDSNGVCVRSGNHCAQPLLRYLGMDSTCRASFSIYNTKEDVDNLVETLKKAYKMFEKYINKE